MLCKEYGTGSGRGMNETEVTVVCLFATGLLAYAGLALRNFKFVPIIHEPFCLLYIHIMATQLYLQGPSTYLRSLIQKPQTACMWVLWTLRVSSLTAAHYGSNYIKSTYFGLRQAAWFGHWSTADQSQK